MDILKRLKELMLMNAETFNHTKKSMVCADAIKEIEQLRKDAERYRFLRDKANANKGNPFISILNKDVFSQWTGENADEAIDNAMEGKL